MRVTCLLLLAALTAAAQPQPAKGDKPSKGVNFYSPDKELALGAKLTAELQGQTTPLQSAAAQALVDRIGRRLAAQIPAAPFPYTFYVIAGDGRLPAHEPIAIPGGSIFVPAQLLLAVRDEAELAGILAHAMTHVSQRHYTRQETKAEMANSATIPMVFMGGGWASYGIRQANTVLVPMGMLQFSRSFESESDQLAVAIASRAGYDPAALARYIGREQPGDSTTTSPFLPTLPRQARVEAIEKALQPLPQRDYPAPDASELTRVQDELRQPAAARQQI